MQWDFSDWGADAVFSGHDHIYERILNPSDDLAYFISGLGGRSTYGLGPGIPGSQVAYNRTFGAMRVTVDQRTALFEFLSIDDGDNGSLGGRLIDSYIIERDVEDNYWVSVNESDVVDIVALTPAAGAGEFVNELEVSLELYDPNEQLVATSSNGLIRYTAAVSGNYTVRVFAADARGGEYVLHVTNLSADLIVHGGRLADNNLAAAVDVILGAADGAKRGLVT